MKPFIKFAGVLGAGAVFAGLLSRCRRPATNTPAAGKEADVSFMLSIHAAVRRDLHRLQEFVDNGVSTELPQGWVLLRRELEGHHRSEDDDLWPRLRLRLSEPADEAILDEMYVEHHEIPKLLDAVAAASSPAARSVAVTDLAHAVRAHLDHEERAALPLVASHLSDREWREFLIYEREKHPARERPQFLMWVLDDAAPEDAEAVLRQLPAPGRAVYNVILRRVHARRRLWDADRELIPPASPPAPRPEVAGTAPELG